jgi:PQQ-like domain
VGAADGDAEQELTLKLLAPKMALPIRLLRSSAMETCHDSLSRTNRLLAAARAAFMKVKAVAIRLGLSTTIVGIAVVLAATAYSPAMAAGSPRLVSSWTVDVGGTRAEFAMDLVADDGRIFIAGVTGDPACFANAFFSPLTGCRMSARSHSAKDGRPLWSYESGGRANSIAHGDELVFVAGAGIDSGGASDFRVVALERRTGQVAWSNGSRPLDTIGAEAFKVVVAGDRVVAAGHVYVGTGRFGQTQYFIRGYDAVTGSVLWEDRSIGPFFLDRFFGLAAKSGTVVASGGRVFNFLARAYDVVSGSSLWSNTFDSGLGFDEAKQVAIHGGQAFVVGEVAQGPNGQRRDFFVRTYNLQTGVPGWSSTTDTGGFDFLTNVVSKGRNLFVAGVGGTDCKFFSPGPCQWLVRSHDAESGAILWEDFFDTGGIGQPVSVVAAEGLVFVAGQAGPACFDVCDVVLRVHSQAQGQLIASDRFSLHGGDTTIPFLAFDDRRLIMVGSAQSAAGDYHPFIRAYRLRDVAGDRDSKP